MKRWNKSIWICFCFLAFFCINFVIENTNFILAQILSMPRKSICDSSGIAIRVVVFFSKSNKLGINHARQLVITINSKQKTKKYPIPINILAGVSKKVAGTANIIPKAKMYILFFKIDFIFSPSFSLNIEIFARFSPVFLAFALFT